MSGLTGYLTSNGTDLSYIYLPGTSSTNSGYLTSNGNDLSNIFKGSTAGSANSIPIGYLMVNRIDINTMYEPIQVAIVLLT